MIQTELEAVFAAERALREAEAKLLVRDEEQLSAALLSAVKEATSLEDEVEQAMRLERLADLCAQVADATSMDAMIAILDNDSPVVRGAVASALQDVSYDYYAEVARAIDRALDDGSQIRALSELPFLLAEVGEGSAPKQLRRFLQHSDAQVIASAIEACVELEDPGLIEAIAAHSEDMRDVTLDGFGEETAITLGALAEQAIEALEASS